MNADLSHLLSTYFWRPDTPWVLAMAALLALVLARSRPMDRPVLGNTLALFLLALLGQLAAALVALAGLQSVARTLHEMFVILAGLAVIRLWGMLVFRVLLPAVRSAPPRILEDIVVSVGYLAWGLVRLRYAGLDLSGIVATSAVITAVLAFAMQDTLGNILGGVALQLDDSVSVGDWIKVGDVNGRVVDIRWRFTAVETRNWETVVIPNSQLMKSSFTVLGRRKDEPVQWRRWIWLNVELEEAPAKVMRTIEKALREAEIPDVARRPAPNCVLMDMESGLGRYAVRYWLTDLALDDPTDSAVRTHVYAALQRAGIRPAVPQYDLLMTKVGEKYAQALRERELEQRLQALRTVDLFAELTPEELRTLAGHLVYAPFAAGDVMTHQGSVATWLYLLIAGEAQVYVQDESGSRRLVGTLAAGNVFGEMGLMTGEPRRATVMARTDVECYRLDKEAFAQILRSRPGIAEAVSRILATRSEALDSARRALDASRAQKRLEADTTAILAKVQRFFGLT